ncbi:MAG: antitoxin [Spirochaetaceae bacterium]|nr:MAG: antitoxin [Spirochaetaceae bacterium]
MLTKLTLTVDRDVVVRAKRYAKRKHRSVSRIIEDYLRIVSMDEPVEPGDAPPLATTTEFLTGMFADDDTGQDYTELLVEAADEARR